MFIVVPNDYIVKAGRKACRHSDGRGVIIVKMGHPLFTLYFLNATEKPKRELEREAQNLQDLLLKIGPM